MRDDSGSYPPPANVSVELKLVELGPFFFNEIF
jgi:hypothetical protein